MSHSREPNMQFFPPQTELGRKLHAQFNEVFGAKQKLPDIDFTAVEQRVLNNMTEEERAELKTLYGI